MSSKNGLGYDIDFVLNDSSTGYPTRSVHVAAEPAQVDHLCEEGYLLLRDAVPQQMVQTLAGAVDRVADAERGLDRAEHIDGNGFYLRRLLEKDKTFHQLLGYEPFLSIARATLGPQVSFGAEARIAEALVAERAVPWHIHLRVIPEPLPRFFCYPHAIHALIYLDAVGPAEGPLRVIPGSHLDASFRLEAGRTDDQPGQRVIEFQQGDALLMHGNLWHSTVPTSASCGRRRLVLLGWQSVWVKQDVARGVHTNGELTDELKRTGEPEIIELLDGFHW